MHAMSPRGRCTVAAAAVACASTILAAPFSAFGQSATRDLSDFAGTGTNFTVTISIDLATSPGVVGAEDGPPDGWTAITNINEGGTYDEVNHKVKWGPFFDPTIPTTLSYDVTPPPTGACFAGIVSFDGADHIIQGNTCVPRSIPSVSNWGMAALALTLLTGATVIFTRHAPRPLGLR